MPAKRIVIIGGGFGGVKCAQTLSSHQRGGDTELVLFNKENHLVFSPLLADAVGSSLSLDDVLTYDALRSSLLANGEAEQG